MGEFIIECTRCGSSFGSEKEYDGHSCMDNDAKVPFKIKLERGGDEEENELEDETRKMLEKPSGSKQQQSQGVEDSGRLVVAIKQEPWDADTSMEDQKDPLGEQENAAEEPMDMSGEHEERSTTGVEEREEEDEEERETMNPDVPLDSVLDAVSIANMCTVCGKRFFKKEDFLQHTANSHKVPRPYQCKVCHKRFTQKHYVTLHMRVHTGERPYQCKLCTNTYTHKTSFTIHMRIHNGDRPYVCAVCGKKCYDKSGLTSHMRSHTKETPYQCEVCGRRFTHSKSLLVHRRNHTGEKPYRCQYCGKCFRHWHKHKIHLRLHTGERPYKCQVCGKGFPRNDEVKRHMRSHQGIKSFKCSICGVYCATQASITGHIDMHHADLRPDDTSAPEKTLVKNSHSGILGTKAPQPRTLYKPIVPVSSTPTTTSSVHTSSWTQSTKTTDTKQKQTTRSKTTNMENTKVLSYKEYIELQEKLLLCKGLTVRNPKGSSATEEEAAKSEKDGQAKVNKVPIPAQTPASITSTAAGGAGQQIMLLAAPGGQKTEGTAGLRLVMPSVNMGSQAALSSPSTTPSIASAPQCFILQQPSQMLLPQNQMGGSQQILLLSKPGGQPNSLMLSQPMFLLSGINPNQRMVLLPSKTSSAATNPSSQPLLIPSGSLGTTAIQPQVQPGTMQNILMKQEPGETTLSTPIDNLVPKVVIKEEPISNQPDKKIGASQLPGGIVIKQEPVDDDPSLSLPLAASSSSTFSNVLIKQEPTD